MKYTREGGTIEVYSSKVYNDICIKVADNGIGIQEDKLPHIFDRFYRTDSSRNSSKGGSGIGLSIVQEIAELHKGKVSARGEGNDFVVTITFDKFSFGHVKKERENE